MPLIASIKTIMRDGVTLEKCVQALGYTVAWTLIKAGRIIYKGAEGTLQAMLDEIRDIKEREKQSKNEYQYRRDHGTTFEYNFSNQDPVDEEIKNMENELKRRYAEEKIKQINEDFKRLGFALRSKTVEGNRIILEYIRLT